MTIDPGQEGRSVPRVQLRVQGDDRLPAALQRGGDRGADLQGLQQEARRIDPLH